MVLIENFAPRRPQDESPSLSHRVAEVSFLGDDELVTAARRVGIPDPYGLTRAGLVIAVAARLGSI